jgi:hydroxypyruvate reductase
MGQERYLSYSIRKTPIADQIAAILHASMQAVDPSAAVQRAVTIHGNRLVAGSRAYDLGQFRNVVVIGFGKASVSMAEGLSARLGDRIRRGVVIAKHIDPAQLHRLPVQIGVLQGDHPVPGANSLNSTNKALEMVAGLTSQDLVFCLVSGGGSALFTKPLEGIRLDDLQELSRLLLASGAEIGEFNILRKHLDQVKGGGLARMAAPAEMITLIVSDVIGSPLDVIASGPTAADSSTYAQGLAILEKYNLLDKTPGSIMNILRDGAAGRIPETLKKGDPRLERVHNLIVADNYLAACAALEKARETGWNSMLLTTHLHGEAHQAGMMLGSVLRQVAASGEPISRPACIVVGGETTVTLRGEGLGGRNQELALGAALDLAGLERVALVTLATDGEDGPTNAAGAVVTGETLSRGEALGLHPAAFLARNDCYAYFEALGDLLITGPSGTNVNDLAFLFAW